MVTAWLLFFFPFSIYRSLHFVMRVVGTVDFLERCLPPHYEQRHNVHFMIQLKSHFSSGHCKQSWVLLSNLHQNSYFEFVVQKMMYAQDKQWNPAKLYMHDY